MFRPSRAFQLTFSVLLLPHLSMRICRCVSWWRLYSNQLRNFCPQPLQVNAIMTVSSIECLFVCEQQWFATEMKIFGLPLGDSSLYCIATNIITPFCEPKIIPLVVDTGTSHTTLNPKGACDVGITSTVIGMLSTEGAITATGTGQYALLHDCILEFLTSAGFWWDMWKWDRQDVIGTNPMFAYQMNSSLQKSCAKT